ncbi:MAG: hypothetical protein GY804_07750 [Alphaproteobacteria bacterium]|nr:hypothetical protein [Alphaproteobacteria bacterium]
MTRIPTLASSNMYNARMLSAQNNVYQTQMQLVTEQKSQNYVGIANDSNGLISVEIEKTQLQQYMSGNQFVQISLEATQNALQGVDDTIRDFKGIVSQFAQRDLENLDPVVDGKFIKELQQHAFDALKSTEFFLNQKVDDKYLFGGGKTSTIPTDLGYSSIEEFQAVYDGTYKTFPESRAANLSSFSVEGAAIGGLDITQVGDTRTIEPGNNNAFLYGTINQAADTTGDIRFLSNGAGQDQIYSDVEGAFSTISAGSTIVIDNGGANDGVHYVDKVSDDGRTITLKSTAGVVDAVIPDGSGLSMSQSYPVGTTIDLGDIDPSVNGKYTVEGVTVDVAGKVSLVVGAEDLGGGPWSYAASDIHKISADSYYQGDHLQISHKANEDRTIEVGINAEETAFEKAIRAMGILAQEGLVDPADPTEAGRRVQLALDLLNDASDGTRNGTSMAVEERGDIQSLQFSVTSKYDALEGIVASQKVQINYLDNRIGDIEHVNLTETAIKLQDSLTSLQIAYATLSKVNELSLINYIQ